MSLTSARIAPCSRGCRPFAAAPRASTSRRDVVQQQRVSTLVRAEPQQQESSAPGGNVCVTCGVDLSKAPGGCDGQGRQMGGLGAVPGFGWWPIKAYRPCPALTAAGMDYTRKGQTVNETLFGGVSLGVAGAKSLDEMKKLADKGLDVK